MTDTLAAELEALRVYADFARLPEAWGGPVGRGQLRARPEDFRVTEVGQVPSGTGEFLYIFLRKTGQNTRWVAKRLAEHMGLPYKSVSYAGLKDRHAITEQWFAVHLPGQPDPDVSSLGIEGTEILAMARHPRKLRPGQLSYNRFALRVRAVEGVDRAALANRLDAIGRGGVPNYFGPQRFGRDAGNLFLVQRGWRSLNREERSFALSALRGALFNAAVTERVLAGNWARLEANEPGLSDRPRGLAEDDRSVFEPQRLPAASLYGKGWMSSCAAESDVYARFPAVLACLEAAGSRAMQRVTCARVGELAWDFGDDWLDLRFALSPGVFATSVLKEILRVDDTAEVGE